MKTCYIFCALPVNVLPAVDPDDLVIAADAGYKQLGGIKPHLVVGDFDSLGYVPREESVVELPVRKDDTDALFAVKLGLSRGFRRFVLLGSVGGRLDHTLANIQALAYLTTRGARGVLVGEIEKITMLQNGSLNFFGTPEGIVSVFAYGGTATGVTEENLAYPLDCATVTTDFPIGVSNEFTNQPARITVEEGCLLIVWNGSYGETDLFDF
ncbi:Thiamine pyrophosphokinase [bioreactor metagenome]|uniref:Thiamine pyrophosphokinase n=1 Tax=bioreactor metagenome TaxID=1076179 RepID=A0A644Z2K9_9ZZZZ